MLAGMDLQPELATIACPVLVLGGSLDRVRPPALAEPVARSIPNARYQVLETGHYMAVATPELVAAAIGDFLDEAGA
jgi:3-oxoadipate enol-lactonase